MIMLGSYHDNSTETNSALIGYKFPTCANRWDVLEWWGAFIMIITRRQGTPWAALVTIPVPVMHPSYKCCFSGSRVADGTNFTYSFICRSGRPEIHKRPPCHIRFSARVCSIRMLVCALISITGGGFWHYDPKANTITNVTTSGTCPPASVMIGMAYRATDH